MKKFVILSLIGLLIMAFGITAYAQEKAPVLEFKASGFLDVISEYIRNVPQPGAATSAAGGTSTNDVQFGPPAAYMLPAARQAFDQKMAYMESRGRLRFDAMMGKEVTGTFFFEFDSTRWGERVPAGSTAQRNYSGFWGVADRSSLELKNMFITFAVPYFGLPVPMTVQAGIHPLVIRPGVFLATDGPGITLAAKVDPVNIKLAWFKALENRDWAADDIDLYALEASAKISTFTVGGYLVDFNANTYPLGDGDPNYSSNIWWFGAYADAQAGPLNLNLDLIFDKGSVKDRRNLAQARDVKYSGWGARANVFLPWEKFTFGFASIYGSGADQKKTSANGLPGAVVANDPSGLGVTSSRAGAYIVPAGTEGSVGDSLIFCGNGINRMNTGFLPAAATAHARAAFGGLWINKIYASVKATPSFKTTLEAMYIADTTKNGNTIGTARKATGFPRNDSDIGWEFDLINELQIYKSLSFLFGGGVLFAGDAMDYFNTTTGLNDSPKTPWVITTKLIYAF